MGRRSETLLILLDLLTAFDAISRSILLQLLSEMKGEDSNFMLIPGLPFVQITKDDISTS